LSPVKITTLQSDILTKIENALERSVLSKTIERLKDNPELNNWVRKGIEIHKEKTWCEFCKGPLNKEILKEYEEHFSQEYENLLSELHMLVDNLERYKASVALPDKGRLYSRLEIKYVNIKEKLENSIEKYNEDLETMKHLLSEKIKNPFKKLTDELDSINDEFINKNIKELNEIIEEHNKISGNYSNEKEEAFNKLVLHYASEFEKEKKYFNALDVLENLNKEIEQNRRIIEKKEKEIKKMETSLSNIARAAKKINQYLKSMFGKEQIIIDPVEKNRFKIMRGDLRAKNLSSGEKTAIAFSYFLTCLEDKNTDMSKLTIFIDDPVSSLDFNHLYNIFAVIQANLNNCHQLIISTHNHEFFNLVKEWLKKIKGHKEKCRFYLIERITKNEKEVSDFKELPVTLYKFKSEYHYLFSKIKSFADNPCTDFENLYQLPNIIRRFLEAFLGFKYSEGLDGLIKLVESESDRIKIERFVHEFSHQGDLNRSLKFCDTSECKSTVDIVLRAVENKDTEHFQALINTYQSIIS